MTDDANIRDKLLKSARKMFAQKGFEGTSVRQICEDAGVNAALISYYFGGKDKIFSELFNNFFPMEQMKDILKQPLSPDEGVRLLVRGVLQFRMNNPELVKIIQFEILTNSERVPIIREHAYPVWEALRQWLQEGKELGIFKFRSLQTALGLIISVLLYPLSNPYWTGLFGEELPAGSTFIEDTTDFVLRGLYYERLEG
ncbi:TetR family transcriptional regulator [Paenibacillus beijingensis]|uniref:TetR family transcriptional regulator n=1 Tax=Paenibacillus beijingensis TaxID=1126833 RepID=UPI0006960497|nr:TetR family transcriptional regulator [Paenibacillus beijingensis]